MKPINNLGTDLKFPLTAFNGDLETISEHSNLEQAIFSWLTMIPGEEIFARDKGIDIDRYIHYPMTQQLLTELVSRIYNGLMKWEYRIKELEIQTDVNPEANIIVFNINYKELVYGHEKNKVFIFTLK